MVVSYGRLLRQRIPTTLWFGQVASATGDRLYSMAMLWLALQLTGSAEAMAMTAIAESLTLTVVGLFSGVLIDRVSRLHIALFADLARILVVLTIPFAQYLGVLHVALLIAAGTVMGALDGIFSPAFESLLPTLVSRDDFQSLAGLMDTPDRFARLFGAGSAAVLLAMMPVAGFFWLDSGSFVLSVISLGLVINWHRDMPDWEPVQALSHRSNLWQEMRAGLGIVLRDVRVLSVFTMDALGNVGFVAYTLGGLLLATSKLHVGLGGYGWLLAGYGVGSLIGNFLAGNLRLSQVLRLQIAISGWLGIGIGFIIMGSAHSIWMAVAGSALAGVCGSVAHVSRAAFMGIHIPLRDLGKVYSFRTVISTLANTLGTVLCGRLLDTWSASGVIVWSGILICIADALVVIGLGVVLATVRPAVEGS